MRIKQQFYSAAKLIKDCPAKQLRGMHPYPSQRDIIILYGLWNGWNRRSIGRYCRLRAPAVKRHIIRLQSNPGDLFNLPIFSSGLLNGKLMFRCEFCGEVQYKEDTTEEQARLHVARHVTTEDYIQTKGVRGSGSYGM